jgi:hypothetical protein
MPSERGEPAERDDGDRRERGDAGIGDGAFAPGERALARWSALSSSDKSAKSAGGRGKRGRPTSVPASASERSDIAAKHGA